MKIVCVCDTAIPAEVMAPMKKLEKNGVEVVIFEDEMIKTVNQITTIMLKAEKEGAEACPFNEKLAETAADADILVVHSTPVNSGILNRARNLKYVMVMRSGIENINEALCKDMGIPVINAPGRSAPAVADMTIGLMLAENKNIARGHKALIEGKWEKQFVNVNYIHDMRRCTVGIIGAGQIGRQVAARLTGFGSRVIVYDPFMSREEVEASGFCAVTLEELLTQSDFVTIHLRLSDKTRCFIGKKELAFMKKTAYFINTARAGLVDEEALAGALARREIGGAAVDVYQEEPLRPDHPYLKLDNITLTPHAAGTSTDTFANSVEIIYNKLEKLL